MNNVLCIHVFITKNFIVLSLAEKVVEIYGNAKTNKNLAYVSDLKKKETCS